MNDRTDPTHELGDLLAETFDDLARSAPHQPDLGGRVRREVRRRRTGIGAVLAGVAAVTVAAAVLVERPGTTPAPAPAPLAGGSVTVSPACRSTVVRGVLPEWARAGFSDPQPVMPYVRSASGNILGILFVDELTAPPREAVNNKILWVWRTPSPIGEPVHVTARLGGTGPAVTRGLPAPEGPSIVDLPSPGCWRLAITWPGGSDTVDLEYVPASRTSGR